MRLTNLANKQDSSPDFDSSRSPSESTEGTPPPLTPLDLEISSYHRLIEDGGRPVCSIQERSHILAEPMSRYKAILPWLSDEPDSEDGPGEMKTVFTRQFTRWWHFRKSQWSNRGLGDSEEGSSAFLEASRRRYDGMGAKKMIAAPSFDDAIRTQWQRMPAALQQPDNQSFSAYRDVVKIRLAAYHFAQPWQLKENVHEQTVWTNWLEYLSYERWYLENLTATVESLERQYHQSWTKLLRAMELDSKNDASSSAASDSTQSRQYRPSRKAFNLAKELEAAQAARKASNKAISEFIRETKRFTRAQTAAYYQRHRVDWVVKEARLMEAEMIQQSEMTKIATNQSSKKRRRDDGDEIPITPQSRLKRTKLFDKIHKQRKCNCKCRRDADHASSSSSEDSSYHQAERQSTSANNHQSLSSSDDDSKTQRQK